MKTLTKFFVSLLFLAVMIAMTGCSSSQWSRTNWRYKEPRLVQHNSRMYGIGQTELGQPRGVSNYDSYMQTSQHVNVETARRYDTPTLYIDYDTGELLGAELRRDQGTNGYSYDVNQSRGFYYQDDPKSTLRNSYIEGPGRPPFLPSLQKKK